MQSCSQVSSATRSSAVPSVCSHRAVLSEDLLIPLPAAATEIASAPSASAAKHIRTHHTLVKKTQSFPSNTLRWLQSAIAKVAIAM